MRPRDAAGAAGRAGDRSKVPPKRFARSRTAPGISLARSRVVPGSRRRRQNLVGDIKDKIAAGAATVLVRLVQPVRLRRPGPRSTGPPFRCPGSHLRCPAMPSRRVPDQGQRRFGLYHPVAPTGDDREIWMRPRLTPRPPDSKKFGNPAQPPRPGTRQVPGLQCAVHRRRRGDRRGTGRSRQITSRPSTHWAVSTPWCCSTRVSPPRRCGGCARMLERYAPDCDVLVVADPPRDRHPLTTPPRCRRWHGPRRCHRRGHRGAPRAAGARSGRRIPRGGPVAFTTARCASSMPWQRGRTGRCTCP